MDIKRILTALIGFPLVILLIILGTPQVINLALMIVAIICMYEYFSVTKKICKPIKWVGYVSTLMVFLVSIFTIETSKSIILFALPIILLILFLHIILTDMKYTFKDVAYTLLGIIYVTGLLTSLGLITTVNNGKYFLVYTMLIAWGTDVFAYFAGRYFGKHHFSKVSPKKTIEGCVTGAISAIIIGLIYFTILNSIGQFNIDTKLFIVIGITSFILSVISQIGDLSASSIKRFADCKDYGTLLPGHGGMLDRIDSLIFIAPFVYMIIKLI